MTTRVVRARVPLEQFNALVRLADTLPGDTPAERAELLVALSTAYWESIRAGREYRPLEDSTQRHQN
jgi:hypothetical protein